MLHFSTYEYLFVVLSGFIWTRCDLISCSSNHPFLYHLIIFFQVFLLIYMFLLRVGFLQLIRSQIAHLTMFFFSLLTEVFHSFKSACIFISNTFSFPCSSTSILTFISHALISLCVYSCIPYFPLAAMLHYFIFTFKAHAFICITLQLFIFTSYLIFCSLTLNILFPRLLCFLFYITLRIFLFAFPPVYTFFFITHQSATLSAFLSLFPLLHTCISLGLFHFIMCFSTHLWLLKVLLFTFTHMFVFIRHLSCCISPENIFFSFASHCFFASHWMCSFLQHSRFCWHISYTPPFSHSVQLACLIMAPFLPLIM